MIHEPNTLLFFCLHAIDGKGKRAKVFSLSNVFFLCCSSQEKKKKYEPPIPTRVGKKKKKTKGPDAASKLPLGKERKMNDIHLEIY